MSIKNQKLRNEAQARLESFEEWLIDQHGAMDSLTPGEEAEEVLSVLSYVQTALLNLHEQRIGGSRPMGPPLGKPPECYRCADLGCEECCPAPRRKIVVNVPNDGEDISIAEQVSLNAGLFLAWGCRLSATATGYCEGHK